ncbi:hypothetical protein Hypma_015818 [Hypsizygus marmoreus]|uniref:Uncharacterized protein n=1 Tax=Hypsizygus marmoreus TaxID=39966 RepID=A0A369K8C5_HYPMA|nr:hypothetical protein Hypma_015818 [Hypsizygus marmoreus]
MLPIPNPSHGSTGGFGLQTPPGEALPSPYQNLPTTSPPHYAVPPYHLSTSSSFAHEGGIPREITSRINRESQQSRTPAIEAARRYQWLKQIALSRKNEVIQDWTPHTLSPEELDGLRHDTVSRISKIQTLEAAQSHIAPRVDQRLEEMLFMARIDYRIRFSRIFRVNDLPNEIIANIFRYVAWSAPDLKSGVNWRLWLTWTCKQWRRITLDDPTLWSAIWFRDQPPFDRSLAWFDRAGSAPLDLRISDHPGHKFTDKVMEPLMQRLLTKISSIRMLIVIVEDWEPVLVVLDKLRAAGKAGVHIAMERFELHRTGSPYVQIGAGYQPKSFREPMSLFGGVHAPCLKYFSINGVHIDWQHSVLTNLTTIDIRRIPLELAPGILQFRTILSSCPRLRKLCLDGAGPQLQLEEARGLPPIQLNDLRILVIADFSVHYAHYILSQFSAPNVRDLTLMNFGGEDYSPLFAMMTSRFPEVRLLTIYSVGIVSSVASGRTIVKWLESMPLVSYLRIANIKKLFLDLFLYDPHTFQHVHQPQSTPRRIVCPQLSILECQALEPDMVTSWGISRRQLGVPLSKIYLTQDMANKITREQHIALCEVANLYILDIGGKAVEEDALVLD